MQRNMIWIGGSICEKAWLKSEQRVTCWAKTDQGGCSIDVVLRHRSFISGNSRFYNGLECRNFDWEVAEVYRGDFRHKLKNPVLVIGQTYVSP